jgi:hypothetical protein
MVFASPRSMCESWQRVRANGWKDPNDRSVPGRSLRIKINNGSYERKWFRYDLPLSLSSPLALYLRQLSEVHQRMLNVCRVLSAGAVIARFQDFFV